jgi:hypothetical protein
MSYLSSRRSGVLFVRSEFSGRDRGAQDSAIQVRTPNLGSTKIWITIHATRKASRIRGSIRDFRRGAGDESGTRILISCCLRIRCAKPLTDRVRCAADVFCHLPLVGTPRRSLPTSLGSGPKSHSAE